jgi:hypothetical protein
MEIVDLREIQRLQRNKYNLVVCELFNRYIHGYCEDSDASVEDHYLCVHILRDRSIFDTYDSSDDEDNAVYSDEAHIYDIVDLHGAYYSSRARVRHRPHKFIRNYDNIISQDNYIQPHIGEVIYLSSGECVAIIKTIWLRLVQKCWRRVYNQKKVVILRRRNLDSLRHREVHGKWPSNCNYLPSIYGMFWSGICVYV